MRHPQNSFRQFSTEVDKFDILRLAANLSSDRGANSHTDGDKGPADTIPGTERSGRKWTNGQYPTASLRQGHDSLIAAYFRIQRPHLVIEYAPQRLGGDPALHVHTMYRDPTNDYGRRFTTK